MESGTQISLPVNIYFRPFFTSLLLGLCLIMFLMYIQFIGCVCACMNSHLYEQLIQVQIASSCDRSAIKGVQFAKMGAGSYCSFSICAFSALQFKKSLNQMLSEDVWLISPVTVVVEVLVNLIVEIVQRCELLKLPSGVGESRF